MAKILVIDDDEMFCDLLCREIGSVNHEAISALSLGEGMEKLSAEDIDVVFLDVQLPDGNGLTVLPRIRNMPSAPEVVIVTGEGDPAGAELAISNGAWDYLEKPPSFDRIALILTRALQYREGKGAFKGAVVLDRCGIVGKSPKIKQCLEQVALSAGSHASVLITGETGTGKELFTRAVFNNSTRYTKRLVVVDCAALLEGLAESTLFGHVKGTFTSAHDTREGLVKQADGGTLFLDEIGELPLHLQKTFLRVLQEKKFRPVGSKKEVESDFRLISATNKNLDEMVKKGLFRNDLLFRLKSFTIDLPPLRERPEDIKELIVHYIQSFCEKYEMGTKGISPEFFDMLLSYDWPGNIRELSNTIEKAVSHAKFDHTLFTMHLPTDIRVHAARRSIHTNPSTNTPRNRAPKAELTMKEFRESAILDAEMRYLTDLLEDTGKNVPEACRISGLSRSRFYAMLKKHNLTVSD